MNYLTLEGLSHLAGLIKQRMRTAPTFLPYAPRTGVGAVPTISASSSSHASGEDGWHVCLHGGCLYLCADTEPDTLYRNWGDRADYCGTDNVPYALRLYLDTTAGKLCRWDGAAMQQL